MAGIGEIIILTLGGIASGVAFLNTFITNRRLRRGFRKSKEESEKVSHNMEKLASALGIISEDGSEQELKEMTPHEEREPYSSELSPANSNKSCKTPHSRTTSIISLHGVKYNKKTGDLFLPEDIEIRDY